VSGRAVVTGGAGFIGSNLVDGLLDAGWTVDVLDDVSTGRRGNLEGALARGARLHEVDVRDAAAVREVLATAAPQAVFHLAAQIDVRRSVEDPAADARINVEGTFNVLEAARRAGVERVVYSSTGGALYGEAVDGPLGEGTSIEPMSPYGLNKFGGESACHLYRRLHGLSTVALRYANVYGPRQDPAGEGGVIAIFCDRVAAGRPLTVFGDGRQTRDFVYVGDVVAANLRAAGLEVGGAYNVGTGVETSVLELAEALGTTDLRFEPARLGEIARSVLDPSLALRELGWAPETALSAGLQQTLASI
jgi:UDP-glucose 4-epimerase